MPQKNLRALGAKPETRLDILPRRRPVKASRPTAASFSICQSSNWVPLMERQSRSAGGAKEWQLKMIAIRSVFFRWAPRKIPLAKSARSLKSVTAGG